MEQDNIRHDGAMLLSDLVQRYEALTLEELQLQKRLNEISAELTDLSRTIATRLHLHLRLPTASRAEPLREASHRGVGSGNYQRKSKITAEKVAAAIEQVKVGTTAEIAAIVDCHPNTAGLTDHLNRLLHQGKIFRDGRGWRLAGAI